ncbi:hypothetical protein LUU34_00403800 [Aix galericulata]|nr:hypothetical protein LUU34_00403800 [Aix galericulata]
MRGGGGGRPPRRERGGQPTWKLLQTTWETFGSRGCSMWNPGNLKEAAKASGMIPCVAEAMLVDCR